MREIKFRAWSYTLQKMVYISIEAMDAGLYPLDSDWKECIRPFDTEDPDCDLMQFTGLKDRNGNEIWEGDILENAWRKNPNAVVFEDGAYRIGIAKLYPAAIVDKREGESSKVIGNIYEHPELLEK